MNTEPELRILRADDSAQRAEWMDLMDRAPEVSPFGHPGYLQLFSSQSDRPYCAAMTMGETVVLYPFLRRNLAPLSEVPPDLRAASDICAPPHGWGGPWLVGPGDRGEMITRFYSAFADWAEDHGVISAYHTFEPVEGSEAHFPGTVQGKLPIVIRTLDLDEDGLWSDYDPKVRNNVRRARAAGLTVEFDETGHDLETFLDIHQETMIRVDAEDRYRFPRSFFEGVVSGLAGRFVFVHVRSGDQIVSTELDLLSERLVYSFAGGTRAAAFPMRPNDLLKHELIGWARSRGAQSLVLGGGVSGDDSLLRYKRSFAPSGTRQLMVGRWIVDTDAYDRLVALHDRSRSEGEPPEVNGGYFPAYRAP